jgi:phage terminase large subunit
MISKNSQIISLQEVVGKGYADFWNFKGRYRACKGSRASKKSVTTALNIISRMMEYPLANTLVIRKTFVTLKDSCFTQLKWAIKRLHVEHLWRVRQSPLEMEYIPTGQKILFRGLDDWLKITSITVEVGVLCWGWIEEAYEVNDEDEFNRLDESLRGELPEGHFIQWTLTLNPWDRNHWIKRRFFDSPSKSVLAKTTNYMCNEFLSPADLLMFEEMKRTDPERYKVAGLGEWGIAEGQFFSCWRSDVHVVEPFKIPDSWIRIRSMDWGSAKPYSVGWYAVDYDGNLWKYRELYGYGGKPNVGTKESAIQVAEKIAAAEKGEYIQYAVLDSACWTEVDPGSPTIAEKINSVLINKNHTAFSQCTKGRMQGAEQVKLRLIGNRDKDNNQIPALRFFKTCFHTVRTIPMLVHDKHKPEDIDTDGEDHAYDETAYVCLSRPWTPQIPPQERESDYNYKELQEDDDSWMAG